ncbi:MAG TPA: hypothetical protein VGY54_01685, partial [Polyangiaceae bacterium]|nr:hypothetical protein [Polyangiaceae bacterium]
MLAPGLAPGVDTRARDLVELYSRAAEQAHDPGRKVSYLERAALVLEELLADPEGAARAYEQVLAIDGDRRSAIVGLERTAARTGNARMLARAFLDEARMSDDKGSQVVLRTRAAGALAKHDPARALQLVREVLEQDATNTAARALETRLYEDAGRWELAAQSLRSRIQAAVAPAEKVALWLALAQLQHLRLFAPAEALTSLERARALDPAHPVPREEMARVLEGHGDVRVLRDAIERLAGSAQTPEERARHLVRAAEIEELRLGDDAAALRTYQRALVETPDDDLLAQRLARLFARRAQQRHAGELAELAVPFEKQIERAESPAVARALSFDLACLLIESGQESTRAAALLEAVLAEEPGHVAALRTLEGLRRKPPIEAPLLAQVLRQQAETFKDPRARLGALWSLAALEEWDLPSGDAAATYQAILDLDPADASAKLASFRCELSTGSLGSPAVHPTAITATRTVVPLSSTGDERLALQLRLVLMLEAAAEVASTSDAAEQLLNEALNRCRDALSVDDLSIIASTGLARIAARLGDEDAALSASQSLAQLSDDPRTRARHLLDGAEILLSATDEGSQGAQSERSQRAASMLERALEADPDSIPVAGRLATVLLEEHQPERVVSLFRTALGRAKSPDTLVMLGSEIARVARHDLNDIPAGVDALRRVRAALPQHVPSLITLAELCIAQRAWPDAVDALETAAASDGEPTSKLTGLFALASIYEKVLARPADVDRVLRAALAIDPSNPRALRALIRRMTAEPMGRDEEAAGRRRKE